MVSSVISSFLLDWGYLALTDEKGILDLCGNLKYPISREKDEDIEAVKTAIGDAALTNAGGFRFTKVMTGDVVLNGSMLSLRNFRKARLFLAISIFDVSNGK